MFDWHVVVIECPYDTWTSAQTRDLFGETVDLKLRGYQSIYGDAVLPIDTYDFVGTHLLICERRSDHLWPIMGFKSVSLHCCDRFGLHLPVFGLLDRPETSPHREIAHRMVERWRRNDVAASYDSSWTIAPEYRKRRAERTLLFELFSAIMVHWHQQHSRPELLACGVPKMKTDRFIARLGYERVGDGNVQLPAFPQASLGHEEVVLMHLRNFSPYAIASADKHMRAWEERIVL